MTRRYNLDSLKQINANLVRFIYMGEDTFLAYT